MPTQGSSNFPDFSPDDFKDPTMFRFNTTMKQWFGKLSALYQSGVTTTLGANLQVPQIQATNQATPPTDPTTLITLQTANALFGAAALRSALATSQAPGSTIVVQPISGSGTGGGGGGSLTGVVTAQITLTAASTNISDPAGSALFFLTVTQDSTGGRVIVFTSSTFKLSSTDISPYPNKSTAFAFVRMPDGNLWMFSNPVRQV